MMLQGRRKDEIVTKISKPHIIAAGLFGKAAHCPIILPQAIPAESPRHKPFPECAAFEEGYMSYHDRLNSGKKHDNDKDLIAA